MGVYSVRISSVLTFPQSRFQIAVPRTQPMSSPPFTFCPRVVCVRSKGVCCECGIEFGVVPDQDESSKSDLWCGSRGVRLRSNEGNEIHHLCAIPFMEGFPDDADHSAPNARSSEAPRSAEHALTRSAMTTKEKKIITVSPFGDLFTLLN